LTKKIKTKVAKKNGSHSSKGAVERSETEGLRIAIVQDYIKEFGGAEAVLETLSDIFPNAPIFTSIYKPEYLGPNIFLSLTKLFLLSVFFHH
jgi:hypothetical protein